MSHDTPEAVAITDKAAADLLAHEKGLLNPKVVGEICPVGTLAKLQKMTALVKELRELL